MKSMLLIATITLALSLNPPAHAVWFDAKTGEPVHVTPRGAGNEASANQAVFGGHSVYWDDKCKTWKDSATGKEVHVTPRGAGNEASANQAVFGGHSVYWVPLSKVQNPEATHVGGSSPTGSTPPTHFVTPVPISMPCGH